MEEEERKGGRGGKEEEKANRKIERENHCGFL